MRLEFFDMTPDPRAMRELLVGCPGLLSRDAQWIADREHEARVYAQHGLTQQDMAPLGRDWCKRYVSVRRHVERMLT